MKKLIFVAFIIVVELLLFDCRAFGYGDYYRTAPIRTAEVKNEEVVEFIQDVIIPLAKSIEFTPLRDDIFLKFYKSESDTINVQITLYKNSGFRDYNGKFEVGGRRQYVAYIDSYPVFIKSFKDNPYIRILDKYSNVRMITHTGLSLNDACVTWLFEIVEGELIYNSITEWATWFKNVERSSLKPHKLRIKRIKSVPTGELEHPFKIE